MIDIEATVRDYLMTTRLVDLTGQRVYAHPTLPANYTPSAGPAVLFTVRGGHQDYSSHLITASLQFQCYALTAALAREVDRKLFDVLNDATEAAILSARMEQPGQLLQDQEVSWFFVLSYYTVIVKQ